MGGGGGMGGLCFVCNSLLSSGVCLLLYSQGVVTTVTKLRLISFFFFFSIGIFSIGVCSPPSQPYFLFSLNVSNITRQKALHRRSSIGN